MAPIKYRWAIGLSCAQGPVRWCGEVDRWGMEWGKFASHRCDVRHKQEGYARGAACMRRYVEVNGQVTKELQLIEGMNVL
jgi:hypothetical protein